MFRTAVILCAAFALTACGGDGLGTQYSSERATLTKTNYLPVTPSARPVLSGPVAITPGAVPIRMIPSDASVEQVTRTSVIAPSQSIKPTQRSKPKPVAAPAKRAPIRKTTRGATKGPIYSACRQSGRKAATSGRCACVQSVANKELTASQQRRGAGYFRNKQKLQDARQSDRASDAAFWKAWKAYGKSAGRQCSST